jgi:F-type H+-transporting ATPase subunit epsilon|tara:strand:+ start:582 stop:968 length:387 start_codon:yes stop_codon:yes gene_type:complete
MSENFNTEIISPEKVLLRDKTESVTIPSFEGEMTILANHISLITFLRPGIIEINGSKKVKYFIEDGTVEFSNNNLVILSSTIIETINLTKDKIDKIIEESKSFLNRDTLDDKKRYILSHKIDCLQRIN